MKRLAPRLLFALATTGLGFAATAPAPPDLPKTLDFPAGSGWVLADLDGDNRIDLATARSGRHDANGYAQEVRITLGNLQQTSFHFQSRGATVKLSSRDVDGDHDRDLVILEPLTGEPIAVWINDGAGSFHEGNLADFQDVLGRNRSSSNLLAPYQRLALLAISEQRVQLPRPGIAAAAPDRVIERLVAESDSARRLILQSDFRPRAPPATS